MRQIKWQLRHRGLQYCDIENLGIADDIEVFLRHVFLSQTAVRLHQYEIDHLNITVLQPSMPKLPLNQDIDALWVEPTLVLTSPS